MKTERTEEQKLARAPIAIKLGDQTYDVKALRISEQQKWRETLVTEVKAIAGVMSPDASQMPAFLEGLGFLFLQFPVKLLDLVCAYAKDLPRDTIEAEGTEEQLAHAFGQIIEVAYPFVEVLSAMSQVTGLAVSLPRSLRPSK